MALSPQLMTSMIDAVMRMTDDGRLVWRRSRQNQNRFEALPSDKIVTQDDFETMIGRRLAGITVGYPVEADGDDAHLWLRFTDGAGEKHYVDKDDLPELLPLAKELYLFARARLDQGAVTFLLGARSAS